MENCIFCKIVKGNIPSYKVFEDEMFLGLLDIFPRVKGHTLLIPKIHYKWVYEVPDFNRYWSTALVITRAMQDALKPQFITYVTYGVDIPHAHIHILPRIDETSIFPDVKQFTKGEMTAIAQSIAEKVRL